MLLDKKFKSEQVRFGAEAASKLGTRSNRYETLLKQRHVQVSQSRPFLCLFCLGRKAIGFSVAEIKPNWKELEVEAHARNIVKKRSMSIAYEKTPRTSLNYKLVPVQYREYEYGLLMTIKTQGKK